MLFVPRLTAPSHHPLNRRHILSLLCAVLLTLGMFTPITAAATSLPSLQVKDKTVLEHDDDFTTHVRIVLSRRARHHTSVAFTTREGTAEAGEDYLPVRGRAYFEKGSRVSVVHVPILGDRVEEPDEYFKVRLYDAHRAWIRDRVGYVEILDDDETVWPELWVDDEEVAEGEAVRFTVELSFDAPEPVRFDYRTREGSADAGVDYDSRWGSKVIDEGDDSVTVTVMTREDDMDERDETFFLDVDDVRNAFVEDSLGRATIEDDDEPTPRMWVRDVRVDEGGQATFWVTLSARASEPVTFDWTTVDGTGPDRATAPLDYDADSGQDVVIPRRADEVAVTVMTRFDSVNEPDEVFHVDLTDVHNAILVDGRGTATIVDTT